MCAKEIWLEPVSLGAIVGKLTTLHLVWSCLVSLLNQVTVCATRTTVWKLGWINSNSWFSLWSTNDIWHLSEAAQLCRLSSSLDGTHVNVYCPFFSPKTSLTILSPWSLEKIVFHGLPKAVNVCIYSTTLAFSWQSTRGKLFPYTSLLHQAVFGCTVLLDYLFSLVWINWIHLIFRGEAKVIFWQHSLSNLSILQFHSTFSHKIISVNHFMKWKMHFIGIMIIKLRLGFGKGSRYYLLLFFKSYFST